MSIAAKLAQIAENEQRVFDAGYAKGKAEGGGSGGEELVKTAISPSYIANGVIINNGAVVVGTTLNEWVWYGDEYYKNMYCLFGFNLNSDMEGQQIHIVNAQVTGAFTWTAEENIFLVTGYTKSGGGTCVVASSDIEVVDNGNGEYLVTVPAGLNIDGVYLGCNITNDYYVPAIKLREAEGFCNSFWDNYQNYGGRRDYLYAFDCSTGRARWSNVFNPQHSMFPKNANYMFTELTLSGETLKELLERNGITLNFCFCTSASQTFYRANVGIIPEMDLRSVTTTLAVTFGLSTAREIEKIILKDDGSQKFSSPFSSCSELVEIRFEGVIGQNGLSFQWSNNLSHDSLVSIINALQDKSEDTSGTVWKVTVGSTNYAKLTTEDLENIQAKGWIFA